MLRNIFRVFALVAALAVVPQAALAQTTPPPAPVADPADAFFDGTVLHDIFLTINSRDWASLKEHFLENTYYPCDLKWNDQTVRNIGIRSRGTGSRSGVKPGLRVDFDRSPPGLGPFGAPPRPDLDRSRTPIPPALPSSVAPSSARGRRTDRAEQADHRHPMRRLRPGVRILRPVAIRSSTCFSNSSRR